MNTADGGEKCLGVGGGGSIQGTIGGSSVQPRSSDNKILITLSRQQLAWGK